MNRWERKRQKKKRWRGAMYTRNSAQGRQANSHENQRDEIYAWAERNGVEIVAEFEDAGISGVTADRPGFQEMLAYVQQSNKGKEKDFDKLVCYDVSRWGRFQKTDESGYYETLCEQNGVEVVFVEDGDLEIRECDEDEDESVREMMREFSRPVKRMIAKGHSRQLSTKVLIGTKKVSMQGYRAGGPAPYGTRRLELNEQRIPIADMIEPLVVCEQGETFLVSDGNKRYRILRDAGFKTAPCVVTSRLDTYTA
jgi:DNA invertase Pin-like site-specific DNA recombinase